MVAARLAQLKIGEVGRGRPRLGLQICRPKTTVTEAAALLNVGERGVYSAKTVQQHGTPEEVAAVEAGEAAVSTCLGWGGGRSL